LIYLGSLYEVVTRIKSSEPDKIPLISVKGGGYFQRAPGLVKMDD